MGTSFTPPKGIKATIMIAAMMKLNLTHQERLIESTVKSEADSGPISPSDERHNLSSGSGNSSGGSAAPHLLANTMPVSDNNVSTTNMTHWAEIGDSEQDINVSFTRFMSFICFIFIFLR